MHGRKKGHQERLHCGVQLEQEHDWQRPKWGSRNGEYPNEEWTRGQKILRQKKSSGGRVVEWRQNKRMADTYLDRGWTCGQTNDMTDARLANTCEMELDERPKKE